MVALILTLIIIIATTAHFYLKLTPMQSFGFVISSIIGLITAFSYYEVASGLLIGKGYIPQLAQSFAFLLIFAVVAFVLQYLASFIIGSNIDFGQPVKITTAIICGIITSLIISGVVIISLGMAPFRKSVPYARFGDTINVSNPSSTLIPADSFVAGFYNVISKGALSSTKNRFDVVHANFLDQLHLNRYAATEGVVLTVAEDAAFVEKFNVMKTETPDGEPYIIVLLRLKNKSIKDGGAKNSDNKISDTGSQVRVICAPEGKKELTSKDIKIVYPSSPRTQKDAEMQNNLLTNVTIFSKEMISKSTKGQATGMGIPFVVPQGYTARYLQYKSNNIIELPKALTNEEGKAALAEEEAKNPKPENPSAE